MNPLIEFLTHLKTSVKIVMTIVTLIVGSTASVFIFIDSKAEAIEHKVMSLHEQNVGIIKNNLEDIKTELKETNDDVKFIKRHLITERIK